MTTRELIADANLPQTPRRYLCVFSAFGAVRHATADERWSDQERTALRAILEDYRDTIGPETRTGATVAGGGMTFHASRIQGECGWQLIRTS